MLNENIREYRKAKGFSQEELAVKLNVVRQTVSKWEKGQSVPDCEMLIQISKVLDISVSTLLGEACSSEDNTDTLKVITAKLEVMNEQYSKRTEQKRKFFRIVSFAITLLAIVCIIDRLITFGSIFSMMTTPPSNVYVSDQSDSIYKYSTAFYMLFRMLLVPVIALIAGGIGLYKTKK